LGQEAICHKFDNWKKQDVLLFIACLGRRQNLGSKGEKEAAEPNRKKI
jgi:hypothetical protein